jgi:putative endonuclease
VSDARPAYVYLLRCRDGSLYCGWTYDVEKRLEVHRRGRGSRYVKRRLPVEIAAVYELPDASAARREEARIKQLTRREKLALAG